MSKHRMLMLCLYGCICLTPALAQTQNADTTVIAVSPSLARSVDSKIKSIDTRLTKQSEKYLRNLEKQEALIFKKLAKVDSSATANALKDAKEKYQQLSQKLSDANGRMDKLLNGKYLSGVDSLSTALGYLKGANILSKSKDLSQKLNGSLQNLERLNSKLNESDNMMQLVKERRETIKQLLSNYSNLPKSISKNFNALQSTAFYYNQQITELKESLDQPDKLLAKTLTLLQKTDAFQKFFQRNSMLSAMFPTPDNYGTPQALAGLQTRAAVQQVVQQQLPTGNTTGGGAAQYLQTQLQQGQAQLEQLKDKLSQLGINSGNSDMVMPQETVNNQKIKPFGKRIQWGSTFNSQRAGNYFPAAIDIALTAAYKLTDKTQFGVGLSGKIGLGKGWQHIRLSGQSAGSRIFFEWKAPDLFKTNSRMLSSIWFYTGAEMNYNRTVESLADFKNYSNYNKSFLAGLSKKYSMNSPFRKGKKMQGVLNASYDFLHKKNIPHTPALVWRVGYEF